jgi:hypothetical protein
MKRKAELNPISAKVKEPPKLTDFPPIVILELTNFALAIVELAILALVIVPSAILAAVTADAAIFAVVTTLSAKVVAISQPAYELFSPVTAPVNLIV